MTAQLRFEILVPQNDLHHHPTQVLDITFVFRCADSDKNCSDRNIQDNETKRGHIT